MPTRLEYLLARANPTPVQVELIARLQAQQGLPIVPSPASVAARARRLGIVQTPVQGPYQLPGPNHQGAPETTGMWARIARNVARAALRNAMRNPSQIPRMVRTAVPYLQQPATAYAQVQATSMAQRATNAVQKFQRTHTAVGGIDTLTVGAGLAAIALGLERASPEEFQPEMVARYPEIFTRGLLEALNLTERGVLQAELDAIQNERIDRLRNPRGGLPPSLTGRRNVDMWGNPYNDNLSAENYIEQPQQPQPVDVTLTSQRTMPMNPTIARLQSRLRQITALLAPFDSQLGGSILSTATRNELLKEEQQINALITHINQQLAVQQARIQDQLDSSITASWEEPAGPANSLAGSAWLDEYLAGFTANPGGTTPQFAGTTGQPTITSNTSMPTAGPSYTTIPKSFLPTVSKAQGGGYQVTGNGMDFGVWQTRARARRFVRDLTNMLKCLAQADSFGIEAFTQSIAYFLINASGVNGTSNGFNPPFNGS